MKMARSGRRSVPTRSRKRWVHIGSRPWVGSSRITTRSSQSSAWASPTRWRFPFDSCLMSFLRCSSNPSRSMALASAVRASQAEDFPFTDRERDVLDSIHHFPEQRTVGFADGRELDHFTSHPDASRSEAEDLLLSRRSTHTCETTQQKSRSSARYARIRMTMVVFCARRCARDDPC